MIIAGLNKDLIAVVHSQLDGTQVTSGVMKTVIRLESSGIDDGKFWDTVSGWTSTPILYPTASSLEAGQWLTTISGIATTGRGGDTIHFIFTDNINETFATTICAGGEHYIREESPLTTKDITLYEMVLG